MPITVPSDAITRLGQYNASPLDVEYTMVGPSGYGYVVQWIAAMQDVSVVVNYVSEIATKLVVSPDNSLDAIVALTQTAYDALDPPDASTMYVVIG
jgi:hypothetical protein